MRVIFMAHPVKGDVEGNLKRAKRMVRQLELLYSDVAIVANWITECEVFGDADPVQRSAGIARNCAVIERCDEVWLTGPTVSAGMQAEARHATRYKIPVRRARHDGGALFVVDWKPGDP